MRLQTEDMNRLSSLYLAMVLLFGQNALLEHEYDFTAHSSGDDCLTCLHATPLSHAMVGGAPLALPLVVVHAEFYPFNLQLSAIANRAYRARAPPLAVSA